MQREREHATEHVEPARLEVGGLGAMPVNLAAAAGHVEDAGVVVHEPESVGRGVRPHHHALIDLVLAERIAERQLGGRRRGHRERPVGFGTRRTVQLGELELGAEDAAEYLIAVHEGPFARGIDALEGSDAFTRRRPVWRRSASVATDARAPTSAQPELGLQQLVQPQSEPFPGFGVLAPFGAQTLGVDDAQLHEQRTLEHGVEQRACRPAHLIAHVLRRDSGALRAGREERVGEEAAHRVPQQALRLARRHSLAARARHREAIAAARRGMACAP